ncbi:HNH endonuclease [Thalassobacillus sp. C254]|uniref:HNH endonuclease n=1 Tax=Thalassobacillus sp. C254 TaxID=1225341 RepID=UPI0018DBD60A|nr:HNH endonuclease [Thalassobacillus sp. C254]
MLQCWSYHHGQHCPSHQPRRDYPELELTLSNLESICPSCHNKEHTEKGSTVKRVSKKITLVEVKGNPEIT